MFWVQPNRSHLQWQTNMFVSSSIGVMMWPEHMYYRIKYSADVRVVGGPHI